MPIKLDTIDKRILRALQRDGRLQNNELAAEVGLSPSPCLRRVKLLEEAGVIQRYVAVLDPAMVGANLSFFARVWLHAQDAETIDRFLAAVQELPQVVECYIMLGDCDAMLRVVASDFDDYRRFQVEHLNRKNGVERIKTEVPSQIVKQTYALPLRGATALRPPSPWIETKAAQSGVEFLVRQAGTGMHCRHSLPRRQRMPINRGAIAVDGPTAIGSIERAED